MILQVEKLQKSFVQGGSRIEVLRGLKMAVEEGEVVAVLGESGSGKSTLLSILAGLDSPSSGTVRIAGQEIFSMNEAKRTEFRAKQIGIIFQQFHLMSTLTALENIALPLELNRQVDAVRRAEEELERVGLTHRKSHFPHQLSGGEKQRVALARARVISPRILLADEPSGSLDPRTGDRMMKLLFDLAREEKTTMLLVTHSDSIARQCDRCLVLKEGIFHESVFP